MTTEKTVTLHDITNATDAELDQLLGTSEPEPPKGPGIAKIPANQPKQYGHRRLFTPCPKCCPWDGHSLPSDRGYASCAFTSTRRDHIEGGSNSKLKPWAGLAVWRCNNCGHEVERAERQDPRQKALDKLRARYATKPNQ